MIVGSKDEQLKAFWSLQYCLVKNWVTRNILFLRFQVLICMISNFQTFDALHAKFESQFEKVDCLSQSQMDLSIQPNRLMYPKIFQDFCSRFQSCLLSSKQIVTHDHEIYAPKK